MPDDSGAGRPHRTAVAVFLSAAVPLVLYLATMPPTITWWFGGSDSGDLVSAAATLGIPHPTGYPLFVLLGHIATRLPIGTGGAAAHVNVMSALAGAVGGALAALSVANLSTGVARRFAAPAAALAALAVATSSLYWSQAIIGEVYALHAALCALVLWLWLRPGTHPLARGAAHGLSLTNHVTAIVLLLAAGVAYGRPGRVRQRNAWLQVAWFALGLATPLLLYLLLPLRARRHPAANWGDPSTPGRFLAHVTGRDYRGFVGLTDLGSAARDLPALVRLAAGDLVPWMLPAAALGALALWQRRRADACFTALVAGSTVLFTAVYRTPDRAPYLLPLYLTIGIWAGVGLASAGAWVATRHRARLVLALGGAATLLMLAGWGAWTGERINLHGDDSAERFARSTLAALPPDAVYVSARDDVTFALWYAQRVLGLRPDVRVIDVRNPRLSAAKPLPGQP